MLAVMANGFQPARTRGAAAAFLDVALGMAMLGTLAIGLLTALDNGAQDRLARAYARQFRVESEDACPAVLGKPFWFACASEARRLQGI